jgi:tubulin monoglycylase TTLL3/8
MVDADLNVWLIEVNSSPSMAYSTPITEKLVPVLMKSIVELVLDGDPGQNFDLIFK